MFGGRAKDRPYPGSTTVTAVNGGISALIRTLAVELAPVRFNAIHPGIVGDSPFWENKPLDAVLQRTPTGRLVTMADVVDATVFLLENRGVNGVNLAVDGGWMLLCNLDLAEGSATFSRSRRRVTKSGECSEVTGR